jgi:hypothetical protein
MLCSRTVGASLTNLAYRIDITRLLVMGMMRMKENNRCGGKTLVGGTILIGATILVAYHCCSFQIWPRHLKTTVTIPRYIPQTL